MRRRSRFVETEGAGSTSEEARGSGEAVVFLHPGPVGLADVGPAVRAVRGAIPGAPATTLAATAARAAPSPASPTRTSRIWLAVLDDAGIDRAALIGCSMGGTKAIDFALDHPDRVVALVLAAAGLGGFEGTPEQEADWEAW